MLEVRDVHLWIGKSKILDRVSLTLKKGEILALIGPNGAGKSSLLNCISGLYRPQKGEIKFKGRSLAGLPPHRVAELGIGRTFQHLELYRDLTVLDNIMAGMIPRAGYTFLESFLWLGRAKRREIEMRKKAEEIIEFLNLEKYRRLPVGSLPPGIQKRVDLGRALALDPEVLLMDEPMAGLTREEREDMVRFILELNEDRGLSILLVEHDLELVMDISHRVVVLDAGRKIAEGAPEEVARNPAVIEAYTG